MNGPMSSAAAELINGWSSGAFERLVHATGTSELRGCEGLRGVTWRLMLSVISPHEPAAAWATAVQRERARYGELKGKFMPDIAKLSGGDGDPLSVFGGAGVSTDKRRGEPSAEGEGKEDDMWRSYYATADLREEINTDLERLYIDGMQSEDHFQDATRQQRMLDALVVWGRTHEQISYRQVFACDADSPLVFSFVRVTCRVHAGYARAPRNHRAGARG